MSLVSHTPTAATLAGFLPGISCAQGVGGPQPQPRAPASICIVYKHVRWPLRRLVEEKYLQKGANLQGSRAELIERLAQAAANDNIAKGLMLARRAQDKGQQRKL